MLKYYEAIFYSKEQSNTRVCVEMCTTQANTVMYAPIYICI